MYKTVEASVSKRQSRGFSAGGGVGYTWSHDFPYATRILRTARSTTTTRRSVQGQRAYSRRGRHHGELGVPLPARSELRPPPLGARRRHRVTARSARRPWPGSFATGSLSAAAIFATPYDAYRQDNISVVDLRGEKTFTFGDVDKVRLFLDGFNLMNATQPKRSSTRLDRRSSSRRRFSDPVRRASVSALSGSALERSGGSLGSGGFGFLHRGRVGLSHPAIFLSWPNQLVGFLLFTISSSRRNMIAQVPLWMLVSAVH